MTADQVQACLANVDGIQKLEDGTNAAQQQYNVQGTPTFLINGQVAEGIATWPLMRDRLRTMGARGSFPPLRRRGFHLNPLATPRLARHDGVLGGYVTPTIGRASCRERVCKYV